MRYYLVVILLVLPLVAHSAVYRWVDEKGQVHFGNIPPKQQSEYKRGELQESSKEGTENNQLPSNMRPPANNKNTVADKTPVSTDADDKKNIMNENIVESSKQKNNNLDKYTRELRLGQLIKRLKEESGIRENIKSHVEADKDILDIDNNSIKNSKKVKKENNKIGTKANSDLSSIKKNKDNSVKNTKNISTKKIVNKENGLVVGNETASQNKNSVSKENENSITKDQEKCGFFSGYVDTYEFRIKTECPDSHCELLKSQLEKYQKKKAKYCQ